MSCSTPNLEPQLFTVLEIGGAVVSFAMVSRWFRETNDCPKNKPTYLQTDEELLLMVEKGESPIQYLSTHPIFKLQLFTVLDLGDFGIHSCYETNESWSSKATYLQNGEELCLVIWCAGRYWMCLPPFLSISNNSL